MNPLDYAKAFTDFWTAQSAALMNAQQQAGRALVDGMQAVSSGVLPTMPTDLSSGIAELTRASQSLMEMLSAGNSIFAGLAATFSAAAGGDGTVDATIRKMVDPRGWIVGTSEMDEALGRMAEGPRFADLWEVERRYARVLQAWMTLRRCGLEHNAVVLGAWWQSAHRFAERSAAWMTRDRQAPDAKAALALWTETANEALLENQRSEPFLQTQAAMIRATTELRMAQQDLVEHFGKQYGFPTRTELDDVHRTVTELRREVRALRREQRMSAAMTPDAHPDEQRLPRRERQSAIDQLGTGLANTQPASSERENPQRGSPDLATTEQPNARQPGIGQAGAEQPAH